MITSRLDRLCAGFIAIAISASWQVAVLAEQLEAFTEPYKRVAIPASEVGVVSQILVNEGDPISERQVLARLEDSVLRASLEVAHAAKNAIGARSAAESELAMREKGLASYRTLFEQGNATQRELDRAESEYHQALARLQSVREELDVRKLEYARVRAQLRQRLIESPIDGYVVRIVREEGEFVSPNDAVVMHAAHIKSLKAVFSVPVSACQDLRIGQTVRLRVGHPARPCVAFVEFVSPVADAETGTMRVKLRIPNEDESILSGIACHWHVGDDEVPREIAGRGEHLRAPTPKAASVRPSKNRSAR